MAIEGDISTQADVRRLIEQFYGNVRPDPVIGHFFVDLDWDHHIPRITAFWEQLLFGTGAYSGDPMTVHKRLHERLPMERTHFDRWLALWVANVDELFTGPKAEEAKQRAQSIAHVMAWKVLGG